MRLFVSCFRIHFFSCSSILLLCGQRSLYPLHVRRLQNSQKNIIACCRTRSDSCRSFSFLYLQSCTREKSKTLSIFFVCLITFKLKSQQKICKLSGLIVNLLIFFLTNIYVLIYTIIWSFITNSYHFFILISQQRHCQKLTCALFVIVLI